VSTAQDGHILRYAADLMYKTKPRFPCVMPSDAPLNVLAFNASLKHEPSLSNTGELAALVLDEIRALAPINAEMVRLSDAALPVGLGFRETAEDEWPGLVTKIKAADIMLFCTPIWWGGRSSLMQRVIERFDALDEEYSATGRSAIKGKVAGIVITGSEDGALSVMGSIMMVLSWMGFTLPPECTAYWVGEVGQPTSEDRDKRLRNMATMHMAKGLAQNLVYYARLLKAHPQALLPGKATCCAMHAHLDAPA